jgi:hypothetical protein
MLKGLDEGPRWLDRLGLPSLRVTRGGGLGGSLVQREERAA